MAPAEVQVLADKSSMNDTARRLFYVNRPALENRDTFNSYCRNSERTIILGCYIHGQGIYIYNVSDQRLSGIKEVTAAHEMLHAAYERLDSVEKKRVDTLTSKAFASLTSERIKATVEQYRQKDPTSVPNELHSILGTEAEALPPELETYYSRYFINRSSLVALSKQYESAFKQREDRITVLDTQLSTLKTAIDNGEKNLDSQLSEISAERTRLDSLLRSKQYELYNAGVAPFNASVRAYNAAVTALQQKIDSYNGLVVERNSVATEENELIKAIDSRPSTIQTE